MKTVFHLKVTIILSAIILALSACTDATSQKDKPGPNDTGGTVGSEPERVPVSGRNVTVSRPAGVDTGGTGGTEPKRIKPDPPSK